MNSTAEWLQLFVDDENDNDGDDDDDEVLRRGRLVIGQTAYWTEIRRRQKA